MSVADPDPLLSVAQAASLLGVHPNTIRAWTEAGRLAAYRINARGDRRYRRTDVERLLVEDGSPPLAAVPGERSEREREHEIFRRIAEGLAGSPSTGAVARAVAAALRQELGASRVAIYLADDDVLDLAADVGFAVTPTPRRGVAELGSMPDGSDAELTLRTRRGLVGSLVIDRSTLDGMSSSLADALCSTIATALAGARVLRRARRELRRTRALGHVTKQLAGELDLGRVLDEIVERTRTLFAADRAGIWHFEDTEHPVALATRGLSERFLASSSALTSASTTVSMRAIRDRRPIWARDADRDPAIGEMRSAYAAEGIRTVCIVPLISRGKSIGVIGLYHDADRAWPTEELALAQSFADQAAIALQNARLYRSTADGAARMRSIHDLSARLNRLTDVRAIGEAIVAEASTLADYHDIRIYRVDRDRGVCDPIAFTREMLEGDPEEAEDLLRVEIGEGFTGWVAEHGEPLLINNALEDERGKTIDGTDDVPESMLLVPMLYEGRTLGVIVLSQLGFDRFTAEDLQTMRIFAGYAAQAMANATTYEQLLAQSGELARRADSQRRLLDVSERLLSSLEGVDVLETIADGLQHVVAYDNLSIYRADPTQRLMFPVLTREHHAEEVSRYVIPFGRGLMGWAVEHAQPILANDALADPRALQIPGTPEDPEAIVVVPLLVDGEVLGALNVSRVGGAEVHFSDSDFELVQLFAAQASIALANADAHRAVRERAETDALTGLANHGAFQRDLGALVEEDAESPLAVLMMDLDRFKAYNDRHGHPAGDALLHGIATAIYGAARSDDRVYRYGGDEFALLLPGTTVDQGVRAAERIRRAVNALTADDPSPVTITIGIAGRPTTASDRAGLIAAADAALYYGKRSGEDRVVRADRLPGDVDDLRDTLDELASAAIRDHPDDDHAVEHLVARASELAVGGDRGDAVRDAVSVIVRSLGADPVARGHADRVGRLAARIAEAAGLDREAQHDLELAGRLHDLVDRDVERLARVPSLHGVASTIAGRRRLVAGRRGRSRRAARATGRTEAHILGVAEAYDALVAGVDRPRVGRREALERLRRDPATWRTRIIDILADVVKERRDTGRRRRAADAPAREDRGAA